MTSSKVLALLPGLSQQELRAVRAGCDRLLAKSGATNEVYAAVLQVAGAKLPFSKFVHTKVGRHWARYEKLFVDELDSQLKTDDKVVRHGLMLYLLGLLANDLKNRKVPVSVASLTLNLGAIIRVFDDAFPGYRENNMTQSVLDAMVKR